MKIKKYFASDMRQAIEMAKAEHGPDVVILSNRKVLGGVELIAAEDYDEAAFKKMTEASAGKQQQPAVIEQDIEPETVTAAAEPRQIHDTVSDIWTHESTIEQMRDEITSLRNMLERQMSGLAWGDIGRQHPLWANLIRHLVNLDLAPGLARQMVREIPENYKFDQAWRTLLALLSYQIPLYNANILTPGKTMLFLGSSGSGKTTTIAKLATRFALEHGSQNILLATTDIYRVGAREQLRSYARILGIPLRTLGSKEEYLGLFDEANRDKLVLVDTAGLSLRDDKYKLQSEMLSLANGKTTGCLILPATEHYNSLSRLIDSYKSLPLDCCIPTKLDEASSLGGLLSVTIEKSLPIASVCDGQRVPEDMHKVKPHDLVSRVVSRARQNRISFEEEHLEQSFGQYEFQQGIRH